MTGAGDRYDDIGRSYARTRREDPRIAAQIHAVLGVGSVVNVGAGSGNYEPTGRDVVAVEPSMRMIAQRGGRPAPVVRCVAESLPFADQSFDVAMAVLTIHHWSDPTAGLLEMKRVAGRQVVVFFESLQTHDFWALEYFPAALSLPTEKNPPGERLLEEHLDVREVRPVLVPRDCLDGFGVAFWARPEAYLDPEVQDWDRRYGHLRQQDLFDGGYRDAPRSRP